MRLAVKSRGMKETGKDKRRSQGVVTLVSSEQVRT